MTNFADKVDSLGKFNSETGKVTERTLNSIFTNLYGRTVRYF